MVKYKLEYIKSSKNFWDLRIKLPKDMQAVSDYIYDLRSFRETIKKFNNVLSGSSFTERDGGEMTDVNIFKEKTKICSEWEDCFHDEGEIDTLELKEIIEEFSIRASEFELFWQVYGKELKIYNYPYGRLCASFIFHEINFMENEFSIKMRKKIEKIQDKYIIDGKNIDLICIGKNIKLISKEKVKHEENFNSEIIMEKETFLKIIEDFEKRLNEKRKEWILRKLFLDMAEKKKMKEYKELVKKLSLGEVFCTYIGNYTKIEDDGNGVILTYNNKINDVVGLPIYRIGKQELIRKLKQKAEKTQHYNFYFT